MAIRREAVRLELEDHFTGPMVKAAAATKLLKRDLDSLSASAVQSERTTKKLNDSLDRTAKSSRQVEQGLGSLSDTATETTRATDKLHDSLDRTSRISLQASPRVKRLGDDIALTGRSADRSQESINQLTGRLRLLGEVVAILGPALAPIGAVSVAGIAGLANQLGVAALAAGVAVTAFQGVGTALEALDKARLEPTAANLVAAREALADLDPAARKAVRAMADLRPTLIGIRDAGAGDFFPGFTASLDAVVERGPDMEHIVSSLGGALGDLMEDAAAGLTSDNWDDFFDFLATDARDTLVDLGTSVGNLSRGFAELWMASDPLSDGFSDWMVDATARFAAWADGLSQTEGFQEFVDYIRDNGPQVADTFSAVGGAILDIVEASAPLGGPVLAGLEAVADAISAVADSDLGTPIMVGVGAIALLNRALALTATLSKASLSGGFFAGVGSVGTGAIGAGSSIKGFTADLRSMRGEYSRLGATQAVLTAGLSNTTDAAHRTRGALAGIGKAGAGIGAVAALSTGAAGAIGMTNTTSLALMGTMAGPWGTALGAAAGAVMDVKAGADDLRDSIDLVNDAASGDDLEVLRANMAGLQEQIEQTSEPLDALKDGFDLSDLVDASVFNLGKQGWAHLSGAVGDAETSLSAAAVAEQELMAATASEEATRRDAIRTTARHSGAIGSNSQVFVLATSSVGQFKGAIDDLNNLLANRSSLRDYEASLDNLQAIAGATNWDVGSEKGRENLALMDTAMSKAITRAEELKAQGKDLAAVKILQRAKQDLDDFVAKTPAAKNAAKGVGRELDDLVGTYQANIEINDDGAWNALNQIEQFRFNDKVITVRTAGANKGGPHLPAYADGGTVPTTGLGYADRHLYLLADGEEITTNRDGEADLFRRELKDINSGLTRAQVFARMQARGLADGGTTGWPGVTGLAGGGTTKDAKSKPAVGQWLALDGLEESIKRLNRQVNRSEKAFEKSSDAQQAMQAVYDDLGSVMSGRFRSSTFGQEGRSPFLASTMGYKATMQTDIASQKALLDLVPELRGMGLSRDAMANLLREGSVQEAQAMVKGGPTQVREYQDLYNTRDALGVRLGRVTQDAAYGQQLKETNAINTRMETRLKNIEAELKTANREAKKAPARIGAATAGGVGQQQKKGKRDAGKQ